MSYAGSFFSAVTSIVSTVTTSVVSIPQKVLAAGGRFNAHNLATPVVKSKAELLSVGSYGVSILWAIGAFLVTAILWTLLPLILGFLNSVFSGFKKFLNYYLVSTESCCIC